jgi:hypothetical protein
MKQIKFNRWTLGLAAVGVVSLVSAARAQDAGAASTNQVAQAAGGTPPRTSESGTVIGAKAKEGFWKRFDEAMREQLGTPAYVAPTPPAPGTPAPPSTRRASPAPFDSPPYPNGEWQIGGTEIVGDANLTPDYPLMQALYQGPHGNLWEDTRIKIYGWEDASGNLSTSTKGGLDPVTAQAANFPLVYDQRPDRLEQNQVVVYAERTPDENQVDHCDWGFRLSQVYGLDYRYMISRGWNDRQLTQKNNFYGTDNPMMYFNLYIPNVADGLNLTLGRIISEADIEAQLAPNNLMSSHSLLYGFDPYCQWGLFGTLKLNNQWTIQAGIAAGNDVTPWELQDPGTQPTATVMFQYQSPNGKFGFYGGGNAINNAQWGFNNIQQYVGTFTYKFNDKLWTSHESWYMYQEGCPGQPSKIAPFGVAAPDEPKGQNPNIYGGTPGAFGYSDAQIPVHPGYAAEWATLNYTQYRLGPGTFLSIRNELFDDMDGNRTGYACLYSEHSIGITWWPNKLITIRPEVRYDHAYGTHGSKTDVVNESTPFDNGTRRSQVTAQFDVIYHF